MYVVCFCYLEKIFGRFLSTCVYISWDELGCIRKLFSLGPHFYKKLLRKQESLMYHHQVLCEVWSQIDLWLKKLSHFQLSSQVKFVTFQTWLDLKFSGSSSFKLENLKLIMVKPDLTWTWNFKFGFKFSSFQGPCWTL